MAHEEQSLRFQVEISSKKAEELAALQQRLGIETRKELFNTALTLLAWATREVSAGRKILSMTPDGAEKELSMPAIDFALGSHLFAQDQHQPRATETRTDPADEVVREVSNVAAADRIIRNLVSRGALEVTLDGKLRLAQTK